MSRILALLLAVLLATPVHALAGLRVTVRGQSPEVITRYVNQLPVGAEVDVRLVDGSRFRAFLMGTDGGELVVMPKTRVPVPQRRLPFEAVEFVELRGGRGGVGVGAAIGIGAAVGAGVFLGLIALAFAASGD